MHVAESDSNKLIKPIDSEKGKRIASQNSEISTSFTNNGNNVKLRNSVLEDRRKSTRYSDADVARHDLFGRNNVVEPCSVVHLDSEPISRFKKAAENVARNGSIPHDCVNKNGSESAVQV